MRPYLNTRPRPATAWALLAAAVAVLAAGCAASTSPDFDSRFGDASRALRAQQLIDANAPKRNADAQPATDGRTMREAVDRQVESFKQPPPTNIINIGVGAGGGGN
jgi:hypothetical protein